MVGQKAGSMIRITKNMVSGRRQAQRNQSNDQGGDTAKLDNFAEPEEQRKKVADHDCKVRDSNGPKDDTDWNPYDQNASSPYFDPEWMFNVTSGFDVVIGNPPYISIELYAKTEMQEKWKRLYSTFSSRGDVYCLFYERGLALLRKSGVLALISSNKFQKAGYGKGLRQLLISNRILLLMDFCELPVFEAATDPMIAILSKETPFAEHRFPVVIIKDEGEFETLHQSLASQGNIYRPDQLKADVWSLHGDVVMSIIEHMRGAGTPLKNCAGISIMAGIKTGYNKAFWINSDTADRIASEDTKAAKRFIKPLLIGDDARRWVARPVSTFLIYTPKGTVEKELGVLSQHISQWRSRLEQRALDQKWYELQQAQYRYAQTYERPKIVYPDIALEPRFSLDTHGRYPDMTAFSIPSAELWLLALLNSRAVWFFLSRTAAVLGDADNRGRVRCKTQYVSKVPVPDIAAADKARLTKLAEQAAKQAETGDAKGVLDTEREIDTIVYRLYGLTPEEVAIVEDLFKKK